MSGTIFTSQTLDNEHPNITYFSNGATPLADAWKFDRDVTSSLLYNNTESLSYQQGAYATLLFYGNALEYWGNHNNDHGACEISLDGQPVDTVNSYSIALENPTVLWSISNLALSLHTFTIQVAGAPAGCEIDRFVINATIPATTNGNTSNTSKRISTGLIVGIVAAGVAVILIVSLLVLCFRLRRRSKREEESRQRVLNEAEKASSYPTPTNDQYPPSQITPPLHYMNQPGRALHTVAELPTGPSPGFSYPHNGSY